MILKVTSYKFKKEGHHLNNANEYYSKRPKEISNKEKYPSLSETDRIS